ncbi:transposase-like protein [Actinoplanes sp. N902-109]|nr:transposase-like protein [Actinoplanes sp. N902-109]
MLELGEVVVDDSWSLARAAERYDVSWHTANKWAQRYRAEGQAGLPDRSSRPHRQPSRTRAPMVRKILRLRRKRRLGPVVCSKAAMTVSTVRSTTTAKVGPRRRIHR